MALFWKNVDFFLKTAVFPGGYGLIGEIQHGLIGVYRVNTRFSVVWGTECTIQ